MNTSPESMHKKSNSNPETPEMTGTEIGLVKNVLLRRRLALKALKEVDVELQSFTGTFGADTVEAITKELIEPYTSFSEREQSVTSSPEIGADSRAEELIHPSSSVSEVGLYFGLDVFVEKRQQNIIDRQQGAI